MMNIQCAPKKLVCGNRCLPRGLEKELKIVEINVEDVVQVCEESSEGRKKSRLKLERVCNTGEF